jgi:serine/threonine-protein kinase
MSTVSAQQRVGTVLARKYRLDAILGEGGMGVVYDAHHLRLDRRVAVKFLHEQHAQDVKLVERFFSEAQAAARMRHPNVVDVHDVDHTEDGAVYMVLEHLEGEPLSAFLAREKNVSVAEILALLSPVLDALSRAHERGIIHRDLKPDNLFLSRDAAGHIVPKVLDFGIAKLVDGTRAVATSTGVMLGTPAYMAPEQALGRRDIGPWTDVWSMGVVLYEALTGRLPFDIERGMTPAAVVVAVLENAPHPLQRCWPGAPEPLARCIDRALAKEPIDRWQSMQDFRAALEASPTEPLPPSFGVTITMRPPPGALPEPPVEPPVSPSDTTLRTRAFPRKKLLVMLAVLALLGAAALAVALAGRG